MLRATNLALVLYMLLYSPFCGAEIGGGSLRNHLNKKQSSRVETIDIRDAGGKTRKNSFELKMTMPGAHSIKAEEYLCTPSKRLSRKTSYIVEYEPHAHASTAHHILLFGCREPVSRAKISRCSGSVCRGEEHVIYAWAKNAKAIKMPKGVGFAVGGYTGINYIVMQVHYARALKGNEKDYSGISIHMTSSRVKHLAEIYMLGSGEARIPPRSIGFHANFACRYNRPYDMIPFAFRTHAHSTARVISGYRVRNGKWKLIGIGNPQLPQAFYPIPAENRLVVRKGDILAGRCTYDTPHRNRWTYMGATSRDEMCNLYLMYYKVYRKGKRYSRRHYSSECMDIGYGISISKLKFPTDSDKLPDYLKTNETHSHDHNHHDHHGMMGYHHDGLRFDDGTASDHHGMVQHHHGLRGNDFNHDDERDEENEEREPDDYDDDDDDDDDSDLDEEPTNKSDRVSDNDDSATGFDSRSPDKKDSDDRLIREDPDSHKSLSASASSSDHAAGEKKDKKDTKKESKHAAKINKSKFHDAVESELDSLPLSMKHHRKKDDTRKAVEMPEVDGDWPYYREKWKSIGQVSALGMDGKNMLLLHRGGRVWDGKTFDAHEVLARKYRRSKIAVPTVLHFDPKTGKIVKSWGRHRFYLPHGLTVDGHGNIWITDVGAHQVYKFTPNKLDRPALTLGVALRPGNDNRHFCKPTDVAVESNGYFFVADGYCNSRILKFSARGEVIRKWGSQYIGFGTAGPFEFDIPHSLALDEKKKLLYVANRELGRINCFTTRGKFVNTIHHQDFGGRLFAISFTPANGGLLYAVSGPALEKNGPSPSGFTIDPKSKSIVRKWSPFTKGFSNPHDVHVLNDGSAVFVSEIGPNRVWKFNIHKDTEIQSSVNVRQNDGENSTSKNESVSQDDENEKEKSTVLPYKLKKPDENDTTIIPTLVIVVVLATPIALICAAATIQHLRFKYKRDKALRKRNRESLGSTGGSGCLGRTKRYYYHDDRRGFDKLIGEADSEESEDDYFVRKGAI